MGNNKIEILSPSGGFDSVRAAVQNGADAVYIGAKQFSARSGAKNFDMEQIKETVEYCHVRDVKVYLTVNIVLFDEELQPALELVKSAAACDIDAVIVQDIGIASLIRAAIPGLPVHGSTQMSVHTVSGAKALYEMGFQRVVLARELNKNEIKEIVAACPIETEVFVHGALCMCVSGQCYFSAMLGSRSGNRGECAQPCRLPFAVQGGNGYALSLKDNSLIDYLKELEDMGVTSAKIEGRMKRPEYVAAATRACREMADTAAVSDTARESLNRVFSRTGFTHGYYSGKLGKAMYGKREKEDVVSATEELLSQLRGTYKDEMRKIPLQFAFTATAGQPPRLTCACGEITVTVTAQQNAEQALYKSLTAEACEQQLKKTGGTPYKAETVTCDLQEGVALPLSVLNQLRRQALEELTKQRLKQKSHNYAVYTIQAPSDEHSSPYAGDTRPLKRAVIKQETQVKDSRACKGYDIVFLPWTASADTVNRLAAAGVTVGIHIPRGMFGIEKAIIAKLKHFQDLGVTHVMASNIGSVYFAKQLGFTVHGGFGLNLTNTAALLWAEQYGLTDVELSVELTIEQIGKLGGAIKRGVVSYGYLPLMLTRNCPGKNGEAECKSCKKQIKMQDRKNEKFVVFCNGVTTEILNCVPLLMPEKIYNKKAINFEVFHFYVENYVENTENNWGFHRKIQEKSKFTRGLYYRGVK